MPSAFAHGLVGVTLASALPRRARPTWVVVALALLAAAPDLDVLGMSLGVPYAHPLGHRGASHSVAFAALVAAASLPLWHRALPEYAGQLAGLCFLVVASHGLLDTFTDAGQGIALWLPFDDQRVFAPWRPIETSPLSPSAFFGARGLAILRNEALWVGLPCLAMLVAGGLLRSTRRRSAGTR